MQKKLLNSFLLLAIAGLTACAGVQEINEDEVKTFAIEQNEEGVFVVCQLPCEFSTKQEEQAEEIQQAQQVGTPMTDKELAANSLTHFIHFEFNQSSLSEEALLQLQAIADNQKKNNPTHNQVILKGFTDDIGPDEFNLNLATKRVASVAEVLAFLDFEIAEGQAHGKCCYLATNETPEGRQTNRRVEVFFINKQEEVNDDANP